MNKFQNDASTLSIQNQAYALAEQERQASEAHQRGEVSEDYLIHAMNAVEEYVEWAVKQGLSYKDLPAV